MNDDNLSLDLILKGEVMQIEKTLINDCLRLSKVSLKTLSVIIFVDINFSSIIIFVTFSDEKLMSTKNFTIFRVLQVAC